MNTASPAKPVLSLPDEARRARDLLAQIGWFNRLRLLAAAVVIWLTGMATHVLDLIEDPWPLYLLGALIAFVDGCYMLLYPRLSTMRVGSVRAHVFVQIAIDLLILTALLHHTGGITNPLVMFYMFHAFIAALVLSVVAAYVVAGCSLLLVTLLGWAERAGALEHHPLRLGLMDLSQVTPLGFLLLLLAYGMTMAFSIYFVGTVLAALRAGEKQLVRLGRSLAMSEKLASVGTLAAGVSHEINNPVGVINNKVQILRYRIEDGDGREQLLGELDVIEKHTRRIGQITAGLLTFSRETPFELQRVVPRSDLVEGLGEGGFSGARRRAGRGRGRTRVAEPPPAGADQHLAQRQGRLPRRGGRQAALAQQGPRGRDRDRRRRQRDVGGGGREGLRPVLHDEGRRHGHGLGFGHQPRNRRAAWRPDRSGVGGRARHHVPGHPPGLADERRQDVLKGMASRAFVRLAIRRWLHGEGQWGSHCMWWRQCQKVLGPGDGPA